MEPWKSKIFENTTRDWSIYVPAQYKKEQPAALMIFQDGRGYADVKGRWRVPVVFDNLIARGDMPPTIAVFINPGHDPSKTNPKRPGQASNRSFEYDSLGDRYARFLLEEIIPEVEKRYTISKDPEMRAICGASSGGICAFTVAWERPDAAGTCTANGPHLGVFGDGVPLFDFRNDFFEQEAGVAIAEAVVFEAAVGGLPGTFGVGLGHRGRD